MTSSVVFQGGTRFVLYRAEAVRRRSRPDAQVQARSRSVMQPMRWVLVDELAEAAPDAAPPTRAADYEGQVVAVAVRPAPAAGL